MSISKKLNLSFPYDWSNPNMKEEVLIAKIVERGIFIDIAIASATFGIQKVEDKATEFLQENPFPKVSLDRMIANIKLGFANYQKLNTDE